MRRSFSSVPGWLRQEGLTAGIFHGAPMIPDLVALDGGALPAGTFDNKVVLFVNVASQCGLTPQYAGLQAVADARAADGLVVVGVPCNQFGAQEPGTEKDIMKFCSTTYDVTFPMSAKLDVNGAGRHPLYAWLTSPDQGFPGDVGWNFEKFLVGRDGRLLKRYPSGTRPQDNGLMQDIASAL
jgi:glutathione peroxidase